MRDYFKPKTWLITILMFIAALGFSSAMVYYEFGLEKNIKITRADVGNNVSGWAWNANTGWISFNCTGDTPSCMNSNYGVSIDQTGGPTDGNFSGYAWSNSLGWISFNRSDTGNPPGQPYDGGSGPIANYNKGNGEVKGWARILSYAAIPSPPPTAPTVVTGTCGGRLDVSWTAVAGATSYKLYRDGGGLNLLPAGYANLSFPDTAVAPSTPYFYELVATNATGDSPRSAPSGSVVSSAACGDMTLPTVSITAPLAGTIVSGTITVTATAFDDIGVVGVQFKLDGADLGAEDIAPTPYSTIWDTTAASNGSHNLTAVARDAAGNKTTSAVVEVNIPSSPGPIAWWKFDECEPDTDVPATCPKPSVYDSTGHGYNLTINNPSNGDPWSNEASDPAKGTGNLRLSDYQNTFLYATTSSGDVFDMHTSDRSVSFWIFMKGNLESYVAFSKANSSAEGWYVAGDASGKIYAGFKGLTGNVVTTVPYLLTKGIYYHILAVWDRDDKLTLWVGDENTNSVAVSEVDISASAGDDLDSDRDFVVGAWADKTNNYDKLFMDDMRIFNQVVSPDEVEDIRSRAPFRFNGKPSGVLPAGTTAATLSLNTDFTDVFSPPRITTCKYSTTAGILYGNMTETLTSSNGGTLHSKNLTGLINGINYNYYVRCDNGGDKNPSDYLISFSVDSPPAPPTVATGGSYGGQIEISWGAVAEATSYKLYRDGIPTNILPDGYSNTTFIDTVVPSTLHTYKLIVVRASGDSPPSAASLSAISSSAQANGWIKLRKDASDSGSNYGVSINSVTGDFSGWAWNVNADGSGIGWISFNCDHTADGTPAPYNTNTCGVSNYKVVLAGFNQAPEVKNMTAPNYTIGCESDPLDVYLGWTFNDLDPGASESAYQIKVSGTSNINDSFFDSGQCTAINTPTPKCIIGVGGVGNFSLKSALVAAGLLPLAYGTPYYWWVKVWDEKGLSSGFIQYDTISSKDTPDEADDSNRYTFTTYRHKVPEPGADPFPLKPSKGEKVKFTDISKRFFPGSPIDPEACTDSTCDWEWSVSGGDTIVGPTTTPTPTIIFNIIGARSVKLKIKDETDTGPTPYYCEKTINVDVNTKLPKWQEVKP